MTFTPLSRRRTLACVGAAVAGLAGCAGTDDRATTDNDGTDDRATTDNDGTDDRATTDNDGTDDRATTDNDGTDDRATTDTATTSAGDTASADLDLREANVVAATVEAENGDGDYRFDVTLIHDDDGENGYADWWQVETLSGERLGRRELAHPHGTREFTRSTTVSIPEETTCVVVRGHDQTHDYGGQAMLVRVEAGEETAVRQGPERRSVADRAC